jgi:DNA-binding LacI/PurR family transcriptional regulator
MDEPRKSEMSKRINAEDVARLAGVSKSAVSRAFAAESSIAPEKKARVVEAAKKLGYRPNALARSLRTTKSNLVGVVLEEFVNPLFLRILELVTRKLQENGLHAVTVNAAKDLSLSEAMELVMQYRIDGLIVSSDMPLKIEYECAAMNIPVISFARSDRQISGTFGVCLDDEGAGRLAARHLIEQGYQVPAFAGGFPGVSVSVDRQNGFRTELAEHGIRLAEAGYAGDNTYDRGYEVGLRLLGSRMRPDSVFCVNDQVAIGVIDAARRHFGLNVPKQLGVIGVDDIWMARTAEYDLTTIMQPLEKMAENMIDFLVGGVAPSAGAVTHRLFQGTLIKRHSTDRASAHRVPGRRRAST